MESAVSVKFILSSDGAIEPTKAHPGDAAYDLYSPKESFLAPGDTELINTGVALELPEGYAGLVLARSGLALKEGVTIPNAPGLIDSGYRGDVGVILHKLVGFDDRVPKSEVVDGVRVHDENIYHVHAGDRIAQLLIVKLDNVSLTRAAWLSHSERADGGFGSSGR